MRMSRAGRSAHISLDYFPFMKILSGNNGGHRLPQSVGNRHEDDDDREALEVNDPETWRFIRLVTQEDENLGIQMLQKRVVEEDKADSPGIFPSDYPCPFDEYGRLCDCMLHVDRNVNAE